jgi:hypothetical protein
MSEGKGSRKMNTYKKKNPTEKIKLEHKEGRSGGKIIGGAMGMSRAEKHGES